MAKKKSDAFVVVFNGAGNFDQGEVVRVGDQKGTQIITEETIDFWLGNGAIRPATEEEAKLEKVNLENALMPVNRSLEEIIIQKDREIANLTSRLREAGDRGVSKKDYDKVVTDLKDSQQEVAELQEQLKLMQEELDEATKPKS